MKAGFSLLSSWFFVLSLVVVLLVVAALDGAAAAGSTSNVIFVHALAGGPRVTVYFNGVATLRSYSFQNEGIRKISNVTDSTSIEIKVVVDEFMGATLVKQQVSIAPDSWVVVTLQRENLTAVDLGVVTYANTGSEGANIYFVHAAYGFEPIDFYISTTKVAANLNFGASKSFTSVSPRPVNFSVYNNGYQRAATELVPINTGSSSLVVLIGYPGPNLNLLIIRLTNGVTTSSASTLSSPLSSLLLAASSYLPRF